MSKKKIKIAKKRRIILFKMKNIIFNNLRWTNKYLLTLLFEIYA